MNLTHNNMLDALKEIIDGIGPTATIELVAEVASAKADHVQASYAISNTDDPEAVRWDCLAAKLLNTARYVYDNPNDFPQEN